jgi:hypothetical protein
MALMMADASGASPSPLEEDEEVHGVFQLIDHQRRGTISEAALAQALLSTSLLDDAQCRAKAAEAGRDGRPVDLVSFRAALQDAVDTAARSQAQAQSGGKAKRGLAGPSIGSALLGILEDLRKFYATQREDYRLANVAKEMYERLNAREETRRMRNISLRQESEHQGVQEAQMMQAMEFNSAWSQNMTEFERQAREIEEGAIRRHQEEFAAFQQKLYNREPHSYKFSRELLHMKASIEAHAKQGNYEEAHKLKKKADQLEKWERMKLDNEHKTMVATKELQLRQQQQTQLEALRRRIQRGREEHKEHWLMGAQRLMQSHRNMLSDLKSKQALENMRADVAVKLDMTAGRADVVKQKIRNNYADTLPRVDTGAAKRQPAVGVTRGVSVKALGRTK